MRSSIIALVLVVFAGCASDSSLHSPGSLEAAARIFLADYARDLVAGDRERIIARYDVRGALLLTDGFDSFESFDQIARFYREQWKAPRVFTWRSLRVRAVGSEVVIVEGEFDWKSSDGKHCSYFAVLVAQSGTLKIRSEIEFVNSKQPSKVP